MKILKMDIVVDKLPDGCNSIDNCCIFNRDKYCALKMALHQKNSFVNNNRNEIPLDCPLKENCNDDNFLKQCFCECKSYNACLNIALHQNDVTVRCLLFNNFKQYVNECVDKLNNVHEGYLVSAEELKQVILQGESQGEAK